MTNGHYEQRMRELGITLPEIPPPAGLFVPAKRTGHLLYCSGQGPFEGGTQRYAGKVGAELSIEEGQTAARMAVLNCLAAAHWALGTLDLVTQVMHLRGYVNSTPDFADHPAVINGASRLLVDLFGTAGEHARCALGMGSLPFNIPVEVELLLEVRGES
jgi:enamine deaminase RidA (YjgF/YER057c/UK114 family)